VRPIRINAECDGTLVYDSYSLIPEPYAHYADGMRQRGVFLGAAGETRWAWSNVTTKEGRLLWKPRLMVAIDRSAQTNELRPGEVQGYLVADQR
jgi:hypothetical protein